MDPLPLIAYHRGRRPGMAIVPAGRWREWMNDTTLRYANRCLPLLVANEAGWWLLNPQALNATWDGDDHASGVTVEYGDTPPASGRAVSLFGYGILTFEIPWLFRAPPEGIVETDWSVSTFTMNWKFTRPGTVAFAADEPCCMIVPQQRRELERFEPVARPVE